MEERSGTLPAVLQIDTGREWRGGQQQVLLLMRELARRGHPTLLATPKKSPLAERVSDEGLPVREIPYHGAGDPMAIHAIFQAIQESGARILHTHTAHAHSLAYLVSRLPAFLKSARPALVVHRRVDFPPASDPLTRLRYAGDPCTFLCVSEAVRRVLEKYGVSPARLRVAHSCVDPSRIEAGAGERDAVRREFGVPEGAPLLGAVGALVPHKGHRFLVAALPRILSAFPEARVLLVGDGPLEAELRRDCADHGLSDRLIFAGFRPDVPRLLHAFDLFVHPSTEEGLGTSILDAMAASVAVVASRAGGIPEAVVHGETGWLVPPGSLTELAGAVISLLEDPRRRAAFGAAGRARLESHFTVESLADTVADVYRSFASPPRTDPIPSTESPKKT